MIFDHLMRLARDKHAFLDELPIETLNPMMKLFVDKTAGAILAMGTVDAAQVPRVDDQLGTIEEGKNADLILVEQNPLVEPAQLRRPLAVVKHGPWLDQQILEKPRQSARNPSSIYLTTGRVFEFLFYK